jgi:hypothetical protein
VNIRKKLAKNYKVLDIKNLNLNTADINFLKLFHAIPGALIEKKYNTKILPFEGSTVVLSFVSIFLPVSIKVVSKVMVGIPFFNEIEKCAFQDSGFLDNNQIIGHYLLTRIEDSCILIMVYDDLKEFGIKVLENIKASETILNYCDTHYVFCNKEFVKLDTCKSTEIYITQSRSMSFVLLASLFNKSLVGGK